MNQNAASLDNLARSAAPMLSGATGTRALFVVSHSSAGGAQELWVNLAAGFAERNIETRLFALYPDRKDIRKTPAHLSWEYAAPQRPKSIRERLALLTGLFNMLRKYQPHYIFTAMPAANVLLPIAARMAGCKAHIAISHHAPVQTNSPMLNRIDGLVTQSSLVDTAICVSEAVRQSLHGKSERYRRKAKVITNALPPAIEELIGDLAARHLHSKAAGRVVAATGRLAAQKNYPTLIRAAQHMPDVTIRIVGIGPDEAALRDLAANLGVTDRVEFVGFKERSEALSLLAQADVFVQPSLFEGHSLALVEASKLGLPLVVSNVPSQIEGITDAAGVRCGLAVDPQDDRALAAAILSLLDNATLYADYAARATRLGASATFETMIGQYLDLVGTMPR